MIVDLWVSNVSMIQLLLHAPIVVEPGHNQQNSAAEYQAWKDWRWSELSNAVHALDVSSSKASPQRLLELASLSAESKADDDSKSDPSNDIDSVKKEDIDKMYPLLSIQKEMSSISPARFRAIMDRGSGHWDIEPVIDMLKDDDNMIPIKNIAFYQQGIEKLPSLTDNEREFLKHIRVIREVVSDYVEEDNGDAENTKY